MTEDALTGTLISLVFVVVGITALGDYFLKEASLRADAYLSWQALLGGLLYSATAFGWIYVMQKTNLAVVGVLYGSMTVLVLVGLSLMYGEDVTNKQYLGVVLAVLAVMLALSD